jgi:hypothetical protein
MSVSGDDLALPRSTLRTSSRLRQPSAHQRSAVLSAAPQTLQDARSARAAAGGSGDGVVVCADKPAARMSYPDCHRSCRGSDAGTRARARTHVRARSHARAEQLQRLVQLAGVQQLVAAQLARHQDLMQLCLGLVPDAQRVNVLCTWVHGSVYMA